MFAVPAEPPEFLVTLVIEPKSRRHATVSAPEFSLVTVSKITRPFGSVPMKVNEPPSHVPENSTHGRIPSPDSNPIGVVSLKPDTDPAPAEPATPVFIRMVPNPPEAFMASPLTSPKSQLRTRI